MASVPNGVETLPKISIALVGCTLRFTDRRQTDGRVMVITVAVKPLQLQVQSIGQQQAVAQESSGTIECRASYYTVEPNITQDLARV